MPTQNHLVDLTLSVLALSGYQSVKFNYEYFIVKISPYQLKFYYYALNESLSDLKQWMNRLIEASMSLLSKDSPLYSFLSYIYKVNNTIITSNQAQKRATL